MRDRWLAPPQRPRGEQDASRAGTTSAGRSPLLLGRLSRTTPVANVPPARRAGPPRVLRGRTPTSSAKTGAPHSIAAGSKPASSSRASARRSVVIRRNRSPNAQSLQPKQRGGQAPVRDGGVLRISAVPAHGDAGAAADLRGARSGSPTPNSPRDHQRAGRLRCSTAPRRSPASMRCGSQCVIAGGGIARVGIVVDGRAVVSRPLDPQQHVAASSRTRSSRPARGAATDALVDTANSPTARTPSRRPSPTRPGTRRDRIPCP